MAPSSVSPPAHGMKSFWRTEPGRLDNFRSTAELPAEADIVVIGAGYSAASFVTHLLAREAGRPPSVVVLEARQLCSGATGRNGGHLKPDSYAATARLAAEYGVEAAAEVAAFEFANVRAVTDFIRDEKIDCDFVLTRAVDVQFGEDQQQKLRDGYEALLAAGVEATKETFCAPNEQAEMLSGVKGAKGFFSYTAGHLWPYRLIHHLFSQLVAAGVNLQTNTPVLQMDDAPGADGSWTVRTARGAIRAKQVVVTTNAYTAAVLPEYAGRIIPYRAFCSHIVTPGSASPPPLLPNTYALRFNDWDFDYLIPRPDGSIIVGGARRAYLRDDHKQWYGNVDDTTVIEGARRYFDGYMQRHFRGWENSGAYAENVWTGIMGYSSDRLPRVGPVPGRPGVFIMGGFTGHGMPQVFLCAKGLAAMVAGAQPFKTTGLPRLFEETQARLDDTCNRVAEMYDFLQAKL